MHSKAKETIVMVKITTSFSVKACWLPNELGTSSGSFQEQKDYIFFKIVTPSNDKRIFYYRVKNNSDTKYVSIFDDSLVTKTV